MVVYHGRMLDTHETHTIFTKDRDPRPVYVNWYREISWWIVPNTGDLD